MTLAGILIVAPPLLGWLETGSVASNSISLGWPAVILAIGGPTGTCWQIVRNTSRLLGSDEVQSKIAENLQKAVQEAQEQREHDAQAGIDPS